MPRKQRLPSRREVWDGLVSDYALALHAFAASDARWRALSSAEGADGSKPQESLVLDAFAARRRWMEAASLARANLTRFALGD